VAAAQQHGVRPLARFPDACHSKDDMVILGLQHGVEFLTIIETSSPFTPTQRETSYAAQAPRTTTQMKRTILFVLVLLTSLTSVPAQQAAPKRPSVIAPSVSTSMESSPGDTVKLSVNLLASGRYWVAGTGVPEEIVPEHSRRYVLPDSSSGVVGSGRAAEPDEDVPAAVVVGKALPTTSASRRRVEREKAGG
jgi:hypothetical protein